MIPRHILPFGAGKVISLLSSSSPKVNSSDLEKAYADSLGVHEVILLPSVRAGIHMAVLAGIRSGAVVIGPAYTCDTVHQALELSGAHIQLVDTSSGSFLMSPEAVGTVTVPDCALLLSELYGIPYNLETIEEKSAIRSRLRILDLAMCIPSPERMKQLEAKDVALFSFGWGKPMYAGWGGIACFHDPELADSVREIRDRWSLGESLSLSVQRACLTLFRVTANQRSIYGLWHQRHLYRLYGAVKSLRKGDLHLPAQERCVPPAPALSEQELRPEWTRPMTPLSRKLALHNLHNAMRNIELRRDQAELYYRLLVEPGIVHGPANKGLPQSHFPIRLPSAVRDIMCDFLRGRGVDTGKLFPFPCGLDRSLYPNAAEAAAEVVTLPLGPSITLDELKMVVQCVKDGLRVQ
jgi:dTDP-4-amino-4,6-dideoxygalactose transaminase